MNQNHFQETGHSGESLPLRAGLILVFLCFLWGANAVSIRISNQGMPPLMSAALRSLISGTLVWIYARMKGRCVAFPPGQTRHALAIGILFGTEFLFMYWGLAFTPASRSAIFLYTHPFWVALGAHFLLKGDRLTPSRIFGLILAFSGLLAVFQARSPELPPFYRLGDLMILAAALLWAASTLYIKRMTEKTQLDHFQTLFAQLICSFPVLALGSLVFEMPAEPHLSPAILISLFFQIVVVAFASYLVWFRLVHRYSVSRLASYTFLAPFFGVILGGLILNEPLGLAVWTGLVCVGGGVYIVNR
ncbi:MAG: DMT family transporter [Desulfococcaceae bacterium]|jgi:drug/metabolite transporter (DMT)-like permease|nr:DMT family transporter [Desulfococcaceae bacterium]